MVKNNAPNPVALVYGGNKKEHSGMYLSDDSLRSGLSGGSDSQMNGFENTGSYRPNPSLISNNTSTWNPTSNNNPTWNQPKEQTEEELEKGSYKPDPEWNPTEEKEKKKKETVKKSIWTNDSNNSSVGEKHLVDEITQPSSKLQPTRQQLNDFCSSAKNLDISLLGKLLEEKLNSSNWQVKLRALYCIESLLKAKFTEIGDYFSSNPDSIQNLLNSNQEGISTKSQKIAKTLNIPEKVKETKPMKKTEESDLFDGMETNQEEQEDEDMFNGMETKEISKKENKKEAKKETKPMEYLLEGLDSKEIKKEAVKKETNSVNLLDEFFGGSTSNVETNNVSPTVPNPAINPSNQHPKLKPIYTSGPTLYQPTSPTALYNNNPFPQVPPQQYTQTVYIVQTPMNQTQRISPQQGYRIQSPQNMNQNKKQDSFSFLSNESQTKVNDSPFDFIQQEMNSRAGK
jgi:hypothetical protein